MTNKMFSKKGFTLLELLIVIAILAILSVVVVLVLNPAETLKKARDVQRISDLDVLKTALGLYLTTVSAPDLSTDTIDNNRCVNSSAATPDPTVFYDQTGIAAGTRSYGTGAQTGGGKTYETTAWATSGSASSVVDGTGWLPVRFSDITGGSPISNLPRDPAPVINSLGEGPTNNHFYSYVCDAVDTTFELGANLESSAFSNGGADDKEKNDGGNNDLIFEKGTELLIVTSNGY
ncbi:MAG: type II secretion system protein [Parcubacteria group bacterium]|nr:type II secretion system protein [Parcubacteria group bacterium]